MGTMPCIASVKSTLPPVKSKGDQLCDTQYCTEALRSDSKCVACSAPKMTFWSSRNAASELVAALARYLFCIMVCGKHRSAVFPFSLAIWRYSLVIL